MAHSRTMFFLAGLAYLAFVVYGSLVPLDFHPRPLDVALRDFSRIPYLRLGMDSRADWVANILLYIPLPFLWLSCLGRESRWILRAIGSGVIFAFCVALSLTIEFAQLFFPPRTVSLNDIIAENMGSAFGIVLWWISGRKLRELVESLFAQGQRAAYAGLILYAFAYLAFSLFPYDFLVSRVEIEAKLSSRYFHWFASSDSCGGVLRCGAKLTAEAIAVAPLGLLLGLVLKNSLNRVIGVAGLVGLLLGLAIETLQFFLVSGLTLGASVLTRVVGLVVGAGAGTSLKRTSLWPLLYLLRPIMPLVGLSYVVLLIAVVSLGKGPLLTLDQGLRRLSEIYFMPFYYHYYTTESAAMTSLLGVAAMFFPIGAQYWIWRITQLREFVARGAVVAGVLGVAIAIGIEFAKLFLSGTRPDPTNVIIASVASAGGFISASLCTRMSLSVGLMADGDRASLVHDNE